MPNSFLEPIFRPIKDNIAQVTRKITGQNNQQKSQLEKDIKDIRDTLSDASSDFDDLLYEYKKMVDEYYNTHQPFVNKNNVKDELSDFIDLIGHSQVIGDFTLLDKWAIQYPVTKKLLTQPISKYSEFFEEEIIGNWDKYRNNLGWTDDVKKYWEYLICKFSNKS